MAIISRNTGSAIFQGLSSFWKRFFKDSAVLDSIYSATEQQLGDVYLDLMETVLSKSLNNTVVFSKRDWSLLVINSTDLTFDPAVYSSAYTDELGVRVGVTALELSAAHDFTAFELTDSLNLSLEKKALYPGYGIFNVGLVNNAPIQEKIWAIVVPAHKTVAESIQSVARRIISSKRIENFDIQELPSVDSLDISIRQKLELQGDWDALTNSPTLPDPEQPSTVSKGNVGWYFQVTVAGNGYSVGDWVISTGDAWVQATKAAPIFTIRYGNAVSNTITLPAQTYSSTEAIAQVLQSKISSTSISPAQHFLGYWNAATNSPSIAPGSSNLSNKDGYYIVSQAGSTVIDDPNFLGYWDVPSNNPFLVTGSASSLNRDKYYVVSVAGTRDIDGTSTWEVGDRVISNGSTWYRKTTPIWAAGDWVLSTGTAWQKNNSTRMNITVEADGGYLIFTSDKDCCIWNSNTACSNQLWLKQMRFKPWAVIPPGQESSIFWKQKRFIQLQTEGYSPAGTEYRFPVDPQIKDAQYIYNTLYAPSVILEKSFHFRISKGFIYFKTNPFEYENLAFRDFGNGTVQLALWLSDVSLDTLALYYNFGYRFTKLQESTEQYKKLLQGLWYYYTHGPQVERIRSALNIIAGIPVVADNDEVVLSVAPNKLSVQTTKNTYEFSPLTPTIVEEGQVLQAFDSMTDAFEVEDYISNPHWYDKLFIPEYLLPDAPPGFRLSSAASTFPRIGDPGFLVGDTDTNANYLLTNNIVPVGVGDYSLPSDAYFSVEKDKSGQYFNILIPRDITLGATTLKAMVEYVSRATKQIMTNPVNCGGTNSYTLLSDATFTLEYRNIQHVITVTPGETAANTSLANLRDDLQAKIDAAFGGGKIYVFSYLPNNSLTLIPSTDDPIRIIDPDTSARSELGFFPAASLSGVTVSEYALQIKIACNSLSTSSKLRIFNMNSVALDSLGMKPFRQGSGDFFGLTGDPTPGWTLMDTYLKYNTFRIKYNPNAIEFVDKTLSVLSVIDSGRPLYTSAMIIPEFKFYDYVSSSDVVIDNLEELPLYFTRDDVAIADRLIHKKVVVNPTFPCKRIWRQNENGEYTHSLGVYPSLSISTLSPNGGSVTLTSKTNTLKTTNHKIEITDISHLKTEDAGTFNNIGIHNRGRLLTGINIPANLVPRGTIGGVYPAHFHRWLVGFDDAAFPLEATHILLIDQAMKDDATTPLDPFARGVKEGDFFRFRNMHDVKNNGEFAILRFYHNVPYLRDESTRVDILAYRNIFSETTETEVFSASVVQPRIEFRCNANLSNNHWIVVLPNTGSLEERINSAIAANTADTSGFPFDISVVDGNYTAPAINTYYTGITEPGLPNQPVYHGEAYKISWDPVHADDDWGIWNGEAKNPDSFFIGQCNIFVHDFEQYVPEVLRPLLAYRGMWNPNTQALPTPSITLKGSYYFVNVDKSPYHNGDYVVCDGTDWIRIANPDQLHSVGEWVPDYTRDALRITMISGDRDWDEIWGCDTDAVGRVSQTAGLLNNPFPIGQDNFGRDLYVDYDTTLKQNTDSFIKMGEVTFWKSLVISFKPGSSPDTSIYIGPQVTDTNRFMGYFDPVNQKIGERYLIPKSFRDNLSESVLDKLDFAYLWDANTNTPAIPVASSLNAGKYYKVSIAGNTMIDGQNNWQVGEYLVSDGSQWVRCSPGISVGYRAHFAFPDVLSSNTLEPASLDNAGQVYLCTAASDEPLVGVVTDNLPGVYLFEIGDWLVSDGVSWVRHRGDATSSPVDFMMRLNKKLEEAPWDLDDHGASLGARDSLSVGPRVDEIVVGGLPSNDPWSGIIGAGALPGAEPPPGYVIGGNSLWTGIIGPFYDGYSIIGDMERNGGYFADVEVLVTT